MIHLSRWPLVRRYDAALTPARLQMHAVVLAAGLWITFAYTLATPGAFDRNGLLKGIDFLQFYVAGKFVANGTAAQLYDWDVFARELRSVIPGTGELLFVSVYPPQLALALAPLGTLPYLPAVALWMLVSALLYAACARATSRVLPEIREARLSWALLAMGFVPFLQLIAHGQVGALALACLTLAWLALRRDRWWLAGLALGSLCFKPQFLTAAVLAVLVTRELRVAAGAIVGAAIQVVAVSLALGPSIWSGYLDKVRLIMRMPEAFEPKPWQMHNLKGFWLLLLGESQAATGVWLLSAAAVTGVILLIAYRTRSADLRTAVVVIGTVLLNPHLYIYDLVILMVAIAALARWLLDTPRAPEAPAIRVLLHLLWWAPLIGPLSRLTHLQVTPVLLATMLLVLWRAVSETAVPAPPTGHPQTV